MTLALLDAHFPADLGSVENPYRPDEVLIARAWNRDLDWALQAQGYRDVRHLDVDHHRPLCAEVALALKRDVVRDTRCSVAIETHCNFHLDTNIRGWVVMVADGDPVSELLGTAIATHWSSVMTAETVRIVRVPDPRYTRPWLFSALADVRCSFVLPELPNLRIVKLRQMLLERGQIYRRLIETTAQAIVEVLT